MTTVIDDIDLNAYLDGELDEASRHRIEAALRDDPEAQNRLRALREQNSIVRAAMSGPAIRPVPADLTQRIEAMLAQARKPAPDAKTTGRRTTTFPMAIAASLVIALAGMLAAFAVLEHRVDRRLAELEAPGVSDQSYYDNALAVALEDHVSGETVAWINPDSGAQGTITPVRTFKATDNDWCREFRTVLSQDDTSQSQRGIACRTPDGIWQTRILVFDQAQDPGPDL